MKLTKEQNEHVQTLSDGNGRITPDAVVQDAKRKESPIHALFEWDLKKAAAKQWIDQAREVIASVKIVVENTTTVVRTPFYVRDPDAAGGQGYRSTMALKSEPAKARESLIFALEVAHGHLKRALELAEPLGMTLEVDALIEHVVGLQRRMRTAA